MMVGMNLTKVPCSIYGNVTMILPVQLIYANKMGFFFKKERSFLYNYPLLPLSCFLGTLARSFLGL
jgi:hypothetical protein